MKEELNAQNPHYSDIDYLLDGLLTAHLSEAGTVSSRVLMGQNFGRSLYIMIVHQLKQSEMDSFLSLFQDLTTENDILVIDEVNGFEKLRSCVGKLGSHLRVIQ